MEDSVGLRITSDSDTTRVEPAASDAAEREALGAVRVLLVADLDPQAPPQDWTQEARRHTFREARFSELMTEWAPTVEVSVENRLGGGAERLTATITASSLGALAPGGLAEQVPALRRARAVRDALAAARDGRIGRDDLAGRLRDAGMAEAEALVAALAPRSSDAAPGSSPGQGLDRLLDLVDLSPSGGAPPSRSDAVLDALVGGVASSAPPEVDRDAAQRAVADLDRRFAEQTDALLNAPEVRRLDAAWRGLKLLVDRADFRGGMRLDVLAAPRAHLAEALHYQVLLDEHAHGAARAPLAAVVVDFDFGHTPPEIEALDDLAATGASLQVPVVASADAAFFGFDGPTGLTRLPTLRQHLAADGYLGYRKLRTKPEAQFLALAMPSFLLRPPHALGDGKVQPAKESGYCWGGGALLAATALLGSHAETGWPTHLGGRRVDDLAVRSGRMGALPLAASFADRMLMDLAGAGFFAFGGPLNRDYAVAGFPSTVGRPQGDDPTNAAAQASLPSAVFTALAAHRLLGLQDELAGLGEDEVAAELEARMRRFLGGRDLPEESVTVQPMPEHESDEARVFGVRLWPPPTVLPHGVGLVLGATVPKTTPAPPDP